jgi:hypothetical protein
MKSFGHKRPIRDESGAIIGQKESPVRAATVESLDGSFGPDRGRRLIVSLEGKELIVIRPFGTRRKSIATAKDVFRWMLQCEANKRLADRMREKKSAKATRLAAQRQARAEAKLRKATR